MGKSIGILLVDDEEGFRETVFERLVLKGHQVTAAASAEAALAAARKRNFEVVVVDVRVLAATNRYLSEAVQQGRFREDLYHRLNVVRLCLPPLRERQEDIPLLAQHFLERWVVASRSPKHLSHEALDLLLAYRWPGNVRELANVIERACLVCEGEQILPEHLGLPGKSPRSAPAGAAPRGLFTLREAEQHHILWTLEALGGRVEEAAQSLGITPRHLYRKLAQYKERREHRT